MRILTTHGTTITDDSLKFKASTCKDSLISFTVVFIGVKNPAAAALLLSFGCGVGVCILLLALAAFLLTHTGLPLSAVRPMACMAAAVGAAVSAAMLARRLRKRLLLCGLGCGAFYAVCLLAATLLANGRLDWQGSNAMLPLALLLGGLLGGALTALRAGR